jgi:molybdopterin-guanine dinucleotide biosynthesis protein A
MKLGGKIPHKIFVCLWQMKREIHLSEETNKLTEKKTNTTGIILAGGKNSRMGTNKAFLIIDGVRLIDNILGIYRKIFDEIIIVTNDPLAYIEFSDAVIVTDIYKEKGALGGIYTGLFYASYNNSFVAACDMPYLNKDFILYMIGQTGKHDIIVPENTDGFQPLHAVYSRNCLPVINRLLTADKLKITGIYKEMRLLKIPAGEIKQFDPDGLVFLNINTPEDYKEQDRKKGRHS